MSPDQFGELVKELFRLPETDEGVCRGVDIAKKLMPFMVAGTRSRSVTSSEIHRNNLASILIRLSVILGKYGDISGDIGAVKMALQGYDEVLTIVDRDAKPIDWAMVQVNRAVVLSTLGEVTSGNTSARSLWLAVAGCDLATEVLNVDETPSQWASARINRGNALLRLSRQTDRSQGPALLRNALSDYDAALTVRTRNTAPREWARVMTNRSNALVELSNVVGGSEALGLLPQAVMGYDTALSILTKDANPIEWATVQTNRANALQRLSEGTNEPTYLRAAVSGYEGALEAITMEMSPSQWSTIKMNLANALQRLSQRAEPEERYGHLKAAKAAYDDVLALRARLLASSDPTTPLINRASALVRLGELTHGEEAKGYLRGAIDDCDSALEIRTRSATPANWANVQLNRSTAYQRLGKLGDGEERRQAFLCAAYGFDGVLPIFENSSSPTYWLLAIKNCAICYLEVSEWGRAAATAQRALENAHQILLEAVAESEVVERAALLMGLGDLAAFSLAKRDLLAEAVVAAEAGRTRQLRDHLRMSEANLSTEDLGRLKARRRNLEELRRRYGTLRNGWSLDSDEDSRWREFAEMESAAAELSDEHRAYRDLLDELRLIGEAIPPQSLTLRVSAAVRSGGGAVMVALAEANGVAFILPSGVNGATAVCAVDLLGFGTQRLEELLENLEETGWLDGYSAYRADLHRTGGNGSSAGVMAWNDCIAGVLEALWPPLMAPIDAALRDLGLAEGAEVTLIVPGRLSILPLHAAGFRTGGQWNCFFDRWSVAYAPSLSAIAARKPFPAIPPGAERVLAVVDPLRDLNIYRSATHDSFPDDRRIEFQGSRATRARVVAALPQADYACFDCHGLWNPYEPDKSGLVLANRELLTPTVIRAFDMSRCRLAALGACETGLASVQKQADEQHGLPLALLQAGVGAVAATFWPLFNTTAEAIVGDLFRRHRLDGLPPAAALRSVLLSIRDGAGPVEASMEARVAVWGEDDVAPPPESTAQEDAARRALIQDLSQPIHWAVYAIFGG